MYNTTWIKLHRKFIEWEWFHRSEMVHLFIYFLLKANHKPRYFEGHLIKTGSFVTGRNKIHAETGISSQTIRTCINRLKSTNEITIKSTKRFSIVTINNYSIYQSKETESNQVTNQVTNQQLTNNQPTTNHNIRIKELKKERIKEIYKEKSDEFWEAFDAFNEMRNKIKKPLTDRAITMLMNKLNGIAPKERDQIKLLNESTMNCWQSIFLPKDQPNYKKFKGDF